MYGAAIELLQKKRYVGQAEVDSVRDRRQVPEFVSGGKASISSFVESAINEGNGEHFY